MIRGGIGADPISLRNVPAGAEKLANLPTRFGYWEGPPFGGGNYHFEYSGGTAEFQAALDAFAAIEAPRLELFVYDGATTSTFNKGRRVDWEFEIWDRDRFFSLNHPTNSIGMSDSPWFRQPLPPPRLIVFLGDGSSIDWAAVRVPAKVTVLDRRVAVSQWAASKGGVLLASVYDMATNRPISGARLHLIDRRLKDVPTGYKNAISGGDGGMVVQDIPAGDFVVSVWAPDHAAREVGYYKNYGRTLGVFERIGLSPLGALKGQVTDADGQPIADAAVGIADMVGLDGTGYMGMNVEAGKILTDAAGRFDLGSSLPQGRVSLRVQKEGYYYSSSSKIYTVPGDDVKIVMTRTGDLHGRVTVPDGGALPATMIVEIEPREGNKPGSWGGDMECKEGGRFEFKGVPPGEYVLKAHPNPMHEGEASVPRLVTVVAGETAEVEISYRPAGAVEGK